MSENIKVDSVDEAIKLANQFKKENKYSYFRGQANASWKLVSTSARRQLNEEQYKEYLGSLYRFFHFCKQHSSLNYLTTEKFADHPFAIMQHYGIATQYIDFTKDPAVAAFFAADTKLTDCQSSCIICLSQQNVKDINEFFDKYRIKNPNMPENFLVEIDVSNLWRLQAQQGVFLFMPSVNLEEYIPLTKIIFPYTNTVKIPRDKIYPDRKSHLELLLDSYFDNENKLVSNKYWKEFFTNLAKTNPNVSLSESSDTLQTMRNNLRPDSEMHHSWKEDDAKKWQKAPEEKWEDVLSDEQYHVKIEIANSIKDCGKSLEAKFSSDIDKEIVLRKHLVNFVIMEVTEKWNNEMHDYLVTCLRRLWDGVRFLPYTNNEIACMLSKVIMIFINAHRAGIHQVSDIDSQTKKLYAGVVLNEYVKIEMGGLIRADSSRALVSEKHLAEAFREDLPNIVAEKYEETAKEYHQNVRIFLQLIPDPKWLYDFTKLKKLFVEEIIPTQIVLRTRYDKNPVFYNPFQLSVFGLA